MPGLGVHRGRRALGDLDDLLDNRARHRLLLETAYASASLYQRLEIHSLHPHVSAATGACFWSAKANSGQLKSVTLYQGNQAWELDHIKIPECGFKP
jgi:hypothetical protein